jgi:hypothetical protein
LSRHPTRGFALLQKAGLVDHQHRIVMPEMLDDIVTNEIAQRIRVPAVARRSSLSSPSINNPALHDVRSCANKGRTRLFTSRSDAAHNSSVVSIDVPVVHEYRIMATHRVRTPSPMQQKSQL